MRYQGYFRRVFATVRRLVHNVSSQMMHSAFKMVNSVFKMVYFGRAARNSLRAGYAQLSAGNGAFVSVGMRTVYER